MPVGKALAGALILLLASAPGSGLSSSPCGRTGQFDEGCRGLSARGDIEGTDVVLSGSVAIPGAPSAGPVFGHDRLVLSASALPENVPTRIRRSW